MSAIWFARANIRPTAGIRMSPVSREGWLVALGFARAMVVGAAIFTLLLALGATLLAIAVYVLFAVAGAGTFFLAAIAHGDNTRTVADYRALRQQNKT